MRAGSLFGDPNPRASPVLILNERTALHKAGAELRKLTEIDLRRDLSNLRAGRWKT